MLIARSMSVQLAVGVSQHGHHPHLGDAVGGDAVAGDRPGPAEDVALEVVEPGLLAELEGVVILDPGGDQLDVVRLQLGHLLGQLLSGVGPHVQLHVVGDLEQRQVVVARHEAVEGDHVAELAQPPQLGQQLRIEQVGAVQLERHAPGREQRHEAIHDEVAGDLDEAGASAHQRVQPDVGEGGDHGAGGRDLVVAGTEQQLVGVDVERPVVDRLPRGEAGDGLAGTGCVDRPRQRRRRPRLKSPCPGPRLLDHADPPVWLTLNVIGRRRGLLITRTAAFVRNDVRYRVSPPSTGSATPVT